MAIDVTQAHDLLHRALETEAAVIAVYEAAASCATDDELRREDGGDGATRRPASGATSRTRCAPSASTRTRRRLRATWSATSVSRSSPRSRSACQSTSPALAELAAAQCIVQAELASRHHWMLVGKVAQALPATAAAALRRLAHRLEPDQEDHIERAEALLDQRSLDVLGLPSPPLGRSADMFVLPQASVRTQVPVDATTPRASAARTPR